MSLNGRGFRGLVFACAVGIFSWIFHEALIAPRVKARENLGREIRRVESKIKGVLSQFPDLESVKKDLEEERAQVSEWKEDLAHLEKKMLPSRGLVPFLKGSALRKGGKPLQAVALQKGKEREISPYTHQIFRVGIQADYQEVIDYLNGLEEGTPFLRPRSLKIKQESGDVETPPRAELEVEVLFRQKSEGEPQKEKPLQQAAPLTHLEAVRDPFVLSRKADRIQGPEPGVFYLTELIFRGPDRYAVINGRLFREGDRLSEKVRVKGITSRQVILNTEGLEQVLTLSS